MTEVASTKFPKLRGNGVCPAFRNLSGSNSTNIALANAFLAAEDERPVTIA